MSKKLDKPTFAADAEVHTFRYRGPDRRAPAKDSDPSEFDVEVRFDAKGNSIWEMRTTIPRRRTDDDTLDLLKCLDIDSLSLDQDADAPRSDDAAEPRASGYNPYARVKERK